MRVSLTHGKVKMFNRNDADFVIDKIITMGPDGIRVGTSQASASARSNLSGIRTEFDSMPLIGGIVRRVAKEQHEENNGFARKVFKYRVMSEAKSELDKELSQQLARARQEADAKLLKPLQRLNLDPVPLAMRTEPNYIVFRGRLAGASTGRLYSQSAGVAGQRLRAAVASIGRQQLFAAVGSQRCGRNIPRVGQTSL